MAYTFGNTSLVNSGPPVGHLLSILTSKQHAEHPFAGQNLHFIQFACVRSIIFLYQEELKPGSFEEGRWGSKKQTGPRQIKKNLKIYICFNVTFNVDFWPKNFTFLSCF